LLVEEAVQTSSIEGEHLQRAYGHGAGPG
jgi:hypothetical protein